MDITSGDFLLLDFRRFSERNIHKLWFLRLWWNSSLQNDSCHDDHGYDNRRGLLTVSMAFDRLASWVSSSLSMQLPLVLLLLSTGRMEPALPSASGRLLCMTLSNSGFPKIDWIPPLYNIIGGNIIIMMMPVMSTVLRNGTLWVGNYVTYTGSGYFCMYTYLVLNCEIATTFAWNRFWKSATCAVLTYAPHRIHTLKSLKNCLYVAWACFELMQIVWILPHTLRELVSVPCGGEGGV